MEKKQKILIASIIAVATLLCGLVWFKENGKPAVEPQAGPAAEKHGDHAAHGNEKSPPGDQHGEQEEHGQKASGNAHAEQARVILNAQQISAAGIAVRTAGSARIDSTVQLPGEIRFNADRTVRVAPQVAGTVESVSVNLGQAVRKGQLLAVITSSAMSELRSEQITARQRLSLAQSTYTREKKLWEEKISAEQDYLQAQQTWREADIAARNADQKLRAVGAGIDATSSGGSLNRHEIRAPFDGVVVEKHLSQGEAVKEDANVFVISDLSTVWAEMAVSPRELNAVRVGAAAMVRASAFESSASGKVSHVGALLGEQTRTAKAQVVLANPDGAWRPGLVVNVDVTAGQAEVPVAVAAEAVHVIEGKNVVFIREADGFVAQPVTLGRSDGKLVEILQGVTAGADYAAAGSFAIKAELGKGSADHAH